MRDRSDEGCGETMQVVVRRGERYDWMLSDGRSLLRDKAEESEGFS